jgi:hypothetical protein
MDPPVSSPREVAHKKAALAAPEPLLEPPADMSRFQGLRGVLKRWLNPVIANSLRLVFPSRTAPAVLSLAMCASIIVTDVLPDVDHRLLR